MSRNDRRDRHEAPRVLLVDDEDDIRELLELTVLRMGLNADSAATVAEAMAFLEAAEYDLCLADMRLPDGEGLTLVREINENHPRTPVAVITAFGSTDNAVAALKAGAFDYLAKPVSLEQLRALIRSALTLPAGATTGADPGTPRPTDLPGRSSAMVQTREMIDKVARSQAPVHISGESGSGKERAARRIHALSARREGPFVPVNCGAIPENLMESEFFGYRKGAFTGADADREGFFQAANGGTLFLDEVADLPLSMQVKLLRVIQEKRVRRVGATGEEAIDVRIVSATHQNLRQLVDEGRFRQDLFYRLNVIELRMPPLRERREDISDLAGELLARLAEINGLPAAGLSPAAIKALEGYAFPGNVRELENILERALALSDGESIGVGDLSLQADCDAGVSSDGPVTDLQTHLDQVERQVILEALERTRFNRTAAARQLGVSFRSLRYRLQRLGID